MLILTARTAAQPKPVSVLCQSLQADETVRLQLPFYPFDSVHAIPFFLYRCPFTKVQTFQLHIKLTLMYFRGRLVSVINI